MGHSLPQMMYIFAKSRVILYHWKAFKCRTMVFMLCWYPEHISSIQVSNQEIYNIFQILGVFCHESCVLIWAETTGSGQIWWNLLGHPLGMSKELITFWTMWPNFQGHQGSKGHKPKLFLCTWYSPNFFSDFDETSWDYALVVRDELVTFWGMWPNFQGHWGWIGQIALAG